VLKVEAEHGEEEVQDVADGQQRKIVQQFLAERGRFGRIAQDDGGVREETDREMGKIACINANKKFCGNDVIPAYETYYKRVLSES